MCSNIHYMCISLPCTLVQWVIDNFHWNWDSCITVSIYFLSKNFDSRENSPSPWCSAESQKVTSETKDPKIGVYFIPNLNYVLFTMVNEKPCKPPLMNPLLSILEQGEGHTFKPVYLSIQPKSEVCFEQRHAECGG